MTLTLYLIAPGGGWEKLLSVYDRKRIHGKSVVCISHQDGTRQNTEYYFLPSGNVAAIHFRKTLHQHEYRASSDKCLIIYAINNFLENFQRWILEIYMKLGLELIVFAVSHPAPVKSLSIFSLLMPIMHEVEILQEKCPVCQADAPFTRCVLIKGVLPDRKLALYTPSCGWCDNFDLLASAKASFPLYRVSNHSEVTDLRLHFNGRLHVILGPQTRGKTAMLIKHVEELKEARKIFAIASMGKPNIDWSAKHSSTRNITSMMDVQHADRFADVLVVESMDREKRYPTGYPIRQLLRKGVNIIASFEITRHWRDTIALENILILASSFAVSYTECDSCEDSTCQLDPLNDSRPLCNRCLNSQFEPLPSAGLKRED